MNNFKIGETVKVQTSFGFVRALIVDVNKGTLILSFKNGMKMSTSADKVTRDD